MYKWLVEILGELVKERKLSWQEYRKLVASLYQIEAFPPETPKPPGWWLEGQDD